jgi:hypothetical protein
MKTTLRAFALAVTAALVLSGCIKMEMNLELQSDDTVNGTMVFAVQEGLGEMLGDFDESGEGEAPSDEEAARELFAEDLDNDFENATEEPYNEEGWVGTKVTFTGEQIDSFADDSGELSIVREDDEFVVSGKLEAGPQEEEGMEELFEEADMTMSITFPGEVTDHNGTLEGNTVTWNLLTPPAEGIEARGGATEGGSLPIMWILVAVVALIVIAAIVTFVLLRSRNSGNDSADDELYRGDPSLAGMPAPTETVMPAEPEESTESAEPSGDDSSTAPQNP